MDINVTFIIQGINFGLCYVMLKYLFFKPAIEFINEREHQYDKLVRDLEKDEFALQEKISCKNALIDQFRAQVNKQFPLDKEVRIEKGAMPVTYCYSNADVMAYQEKFKELLLAEANHAR